MLSYTIKRVATGYCLYNNRTGKKLKTVYKSIEAAKKALNRLKSRSKGAKDYHQCCKSHGCGAKNKHNVKPKPKKRATLVNISKKPMSGVSAGLMSSGVGQGARKAMKYLTSKEFEMKARKLDKEYKDVI